jgi:hypothetical protein
MFREASTFNRDLCAWGSKLPLEDPLFRSTGTFVSSGCIAKDDPSLEVPFYPGPFCTSCFPKKSSVVYSSNYMP